MKSFIVAIPKNKIAAPHWTVGIEVSYYFIFRNSPKIYLSAKELVSYSRFEARHACFSSTAPFGTSLFTNDTC